MTLGTFRHEKDTVFTDFPYVGSPVGRPLDTKAKINGTPYSVSYENFVLKLFRDEGVIAERKLPGIFYMHPINSGCILGQARSDDIVVLRTISRATTGLHYICVISGEGEILFEGVVKASEDWDMLPGEGRKIVIGGARTKKVITVALDK